MAHTLKDLLESPVGLFFENDWKFFHCGRWYSVVAIHGIDDSTRAEYEAAPRTVRTSYREYPNQGKPGQLKAQLPESLVVHPIAIPGKG